VGAEDGDAVRHAVPVDRVLVDRDAGRGVVRRLAGRVERDHVAAGDRPALVVAQGHLVGRVAVGHQRRIVHRRQPAAGDARAVGDVVAALEVEAVALHAGVRPAADVLGVADLIRREAHAVLEVMGGAVVDRRVRAVRVVPAGRAVGDLLTAGDAVAERRAVAAVGHEAERLAARDGAGGAAHRRRGAGAPHVLRHHAVDEHVLRAVEVQRGEQRTVELVARGRQVRELVVAVAVEHAVADREPARLCPRVAGRGVDVADDVALLHDAVGHRGVVDELQRHAAEVQVDALAHPDRRGPHRGRRMVAQRDGVGARPGEVDARRPVARQVVGVRRVDRLLDLRALIDGREARSGPVGADVDAGAGAGASHHRQCRDLDINARTTTRNVEIHVAVQRDRGTSADRPDPRRRLGDVLVIAVIERSRAVVRERRAGVTNPDRHRRVPC
jgi:hypothetical protein